jgi:hypothetical protein
MTEIDEETLRDQLKVKRNSLQKEFHMNPSNTRLALEIRLIDDLIASLGKYLQMQKAPKAKAGQNTRLGSTYTDWNGAKLS